MRIYKTSKDNRFNNSIVMVVVLATVLVLAPAAVVLLYHSPSIAAGQSSPSNQSKKSSANATGGGKIGNVKQLAKVAGNNSQIIANNTKIGTGKTFQAFGKEHKVTAPTPMSIKTLPLNPQLAKSKNMSTSAGSVAGVSNKTANMTNSTSGTAKNMTGAAMGGIKSLHHLGGGKPAG